MAAVAFVSPGVVALAGALAAALPLAAPAVAVAQSEDGAAGGSGGAPKGPPPSPVKVAEVTREELAPRKRVFGELRAARRATIAAEEGGIVREVLVREGQRAEAGAVLVRMDDTRLTLQLAANTAALAAAKATVGEREATIAREERTIDLLKRAAAEGGTNPREMSDAESDLAVARAQAEQARAAVTVIEQQGALLERRIADLAVKAPYAGVVTMRHADVGAWIADGGAVVDFVGTGELEAWFDVPQELLKSARQLVADSASSTTRALPIEIETAGGDELPATRIRVIPSIDPRSRTFVTILTVIDRDGVLAPGLALTAYVPAGAVAPRLVVPKDAILRGDAGPYVFAVRGGMAMPVNVRVAFPIGDRVALEAGAALEPGVQVVVEGNERLMPMSPVAPIAAGGVGAVGAGAAGTAGGTAAGSEGAK
ncbi:MAG: efflux RND transporter periplasmic adaptor subunit [Phycisphaerales bacterium]